MYFSARITKKLTARGWDNSVDVPLVLVVLLSEARVGGFFVCRPREMMLCVRSLLSFTPFQTFEQGPVLHRHTVMHSRLLSLLPTWSNRNYCIATLEQDRVGNFGVVRPLRSHPAISQGGSVGRLTLERY